MIHKTLFDYSSARLKLKTENSFRKIKSTISKFHPVNIQFEINILKSNHNKSSFKCKQNAIKYSGNSISWIEFVCMNANYAKNGFLCVISYIK